MCLGIPMKIVEINDSLARCEARGIERDVSLFMLQHEDPDVGDPSIGDPVVGDYVLVHVGYAIQKVTEIEARTAWQLHDEMLALEVADLAGKHDGNQAGA